MATGPMSPETPPDRGDAGFSEEEVRDLLAHLYDSAYLLQHRLLPLLLRRHLPDPVARTQHLRSLVIDTINSLRPQPAVPPRSREWRPYGVLVYRYIDGMSDEEIETDLAISKRQLYRDLKSGVTALTSVLQAQAAPPRPEPASQEALSDSLKRVGLRFERLDVGSLCQQVLPLVQGLCESLGRTVHLLPPDATAMAVADVALSRQALISSLSTALRCSGGDITVRQSAGLQTQMLTVSFAAPVGEAALDRETLEFPRQLMEEQGGLLQVNTQGEPSLCLQWRRFEEPCVLIVEDDPSMLRLLSRCLNGHGYRVVGTVEAAQAVQLAMQNQARLVILDVMMRDLDGWEVLQRLKAEPTTQAVPVLVCSVVNEPQLALTLGAAGLLRKPVSCEGLVAAVANTIGI
ncbi:MAG: response regulator [Anaerolineae bacterium]